jgi:Fe-S-cluster-containing dehydrogenase component
MVPQQQMMKCDMCYDRTSVGKRPMCATVCPSGALSYVRPAEMAERRRQVPVRQFRFGAQLVETKVRMMAPRQAREISIDVADYMWEPR